MTNYRNIVVVFSFGIYTQSSERAFKASIEPSIEGGVLEKGVHFGKFVVFLDHTKIIVKQ